MNKFNFVFFGTPDIAKQTLEILASNGYFPSIVVTSPDARSGRGMNMSQSPVSLWANGNNIPCLKPERIDQTFIDEFKKNSIDLSIVVAYGKILPEKLINIPELGTINIHYSLLPKYRGASPLESALLNGDETTGVSIQQMKFKLDSGPILAYKEVPINHNETKNELKEKLIILGGDLLCDTIPMIIKKRIISKVQDDSKATYCTKINKEDGEIDLNDNPLKNYNKYRAFFGWPGIYFFILKNGQKKRIKINQALYENGEFKIKRVTPEGKKELDYIDFLSQK